MTPPFFRISSTHVRIVCRGSGCAHRRYAFRRHEQTTAPPSRHWENGAGGEERLTHSPEINLACRVLARLGLAVTVDVIALARNWRSRSCRRSDPVQPPRGIQIGDAPRAADALDQPAQDGPQVAVRGILVERFERREDGGNLHAG